MILGGKELFDNNAPGIWLCEKADSKSVDTFFIK